MTEQSLDDAYQRILEQSRRKGDVLGEPGGGERRRHPRIKVNPGDLPSELDPWVFAIDISISGMAFYSDDPVAEGETVSVALGNMMAVDAQVVGCREETTDGPDPHTRYVLHCTFADEEQGKRLIVAIKDLESTGSAP